MKTVLGIKKLGAPLAKSVLTIGNFDGLHVGHRKIISRLKVLASKQGASSVVMTFDPHPRQVLLPDQEFHRLYPQIDLESELTKLDIDHFVVEPFSRDLSILEPEVFIREYIYKPFQPVALVVGYDFSFGANRKGTLNVLEKICSDLGVSLEVIPPQKIEDAIISSTRIRQLIVSGDVELAAKMLGRGFSVEGLVEKGAGRGKRLGTPTANLHMTGYSLPGHGVYAGWAEFKGKRYKAVCNIGVNPTFHQGHGLPVKVEVHLLDFTSDLYGETLKMEFTTRLRSEMKFESVEKLMDQIRQDIEAARIKLS